MPPSIPDKPGDLVDELLQQREWIQGLARRLCRDEHAAEDSVQSVYAQVVQSPPRHNENLRGWLTRLLQHTLGMQRRSNTRRMRREAVTVAVKSGQHAEATVDAVARAEAHRHLVDRILLLPEPQRGLVLRHYFEGVSVADLAVQCTLTADAVRGHLRRAREKLRGDLEQSSIEQRRGLVLLAGLGAKPLATTVALGMIMIMKLAVSVSVMGGALLWWSPWGELATPTPGAAHDIASVSYSELEGDMQRRGAQSMEVLQRTQKTQSLPVEQQPLVVQSRLVGLIPDVPWRAKIHLRLTGKVDAHSREYDARLTPHADGRLALQLPAWVRHADLWELRLESAEGDPNYDLEKVVVGAQIINEREPLSLPVTIIARLSGRVLDDSGSGVAAATVCAYRVEGGLPKGAPLASCNTNADGKYTLRSPKAGSLALLAVPMLPAQSSGLGPTGVGGGARAGDAVRTDILPRAIVVAATFAEQQECTDHCLPTATNIVARVFLPEGVAASEARIRVSPLEWAAAVSTARGVRVVLWDIDRAVVKPKQVQMDCAGPQPTALLSFPAGVRVKLTPWLAGDDVLQLVAQPATIAVSPQTVDTTVSGNLRTLEIRGAGQPCVGALVTNDNTGPFFVVRTDAEGQCKLLLPDSGGTCVVHVDGFAKHRQDLGAAKGLPDPMVVDLSSDPMANMQVHCTGSIPVDKVTLTYRAVGSHFFQTSSVTEQAPATGQFSFALPAGDYKLTLQAHSEAAPTNAFLIATQREITLPPEGQRIDWLVKTGGRILMEVHDADGPRTDWRAVLLRGEHVVTTIRPRENCSAESANLPVGAYMLRTTMADGRQQLTRVQIAHRKVIPIRVDIR